MDAVRSAQLLVGLSLTATAVAGSVVALLGGGGAAIVPVVGVSAVGLVAAMLILWFRQRPVAPDDESMYLQTAVTKLTTAEGPALIAIVLAIVLGPGWVSLFGVLVSLLLGWWVWPSRSDLERHNLLYLT